MQVLNVLGQYPGDPGPPGGDCAGHALSKVIPLLVKGMGVYGLAFAPLATAARTDARLLGPQPHTLSFEGSGILPTVFNTVHLSLSAAQLHGTQRVLLAAAAGGVGIVGMQYCAWLSTHVLGTVPVSFPVSCRGPRYTACPCSCRGPHYITPLKRGGAVGCHILRIHRSF